MKRADLEHVSDDCFAGRGGIRQPMCQRVFAPLENVMK